MGRHYFQHLLKFLQNLEYQATKHCTVQISIWHWKVRASFFAINKHSKEIHNVVALIKCLLVLRCQLYMFRTVTVHPQELLSRYCICRLWYVLIRPAGTTFQEERTSWKYQVVRFLPRTIICTYSIYKEAPEDGPLRSETCRADT